MRWFVVLAVLAAGCPSPPNPKPDGPPRLADAAPVATCSLDAGLPTTADVCDQQVHGNRPCAVCPGGADQCLDTVDMIWCVRSCSDCAADTGTSSSSRPKRSAVLK